MATRIWYVGATPCTTPSLGRDDVWTPGSFKDPDPTLAEGLGVDASGSLFVSTDPTPTPVAEPTVDPVPEPSPEPAPVEETPVTPSVES